MVMEFVCGVQNLDEHLVLVYHKESSMYLERALCLLCDVAQGCIFLHRCETPARHTPELRAESRKLRVESRELRAESREPRAESRELRAES